MAMVFAAEGLDGPEKLLLLAYTNYTDAHGYCWPGEDRLADDTGTSPSTVRRTKKKLIGRNLVKSVRRAETSNLTRVNLPLLASMGRKRKAYDDNEMERLSFDETGSDQQTGQSDLYPSQGSDLRTVQSDLNQVSDCSVGQVNLTCGGGQSDLQSISDPSVDPVVIPQSLDGRSPATSGSRGSSSSGSAASGKTKSTFSREERRQYDAFVAALPAPLKALVPKGLPQPLVRAVLDATAPENPAGRTVQQLIEYRLMPKWDRYYSSRDQAGRIEKPVGVLVAMLRRDAECGDPRCDERTNVDTGMPCQACEMRAVDRRAHRENGPEHRSEADHLGGVPAPRTAAPDGIARATCPGDGCGGVPILLVGPAVQDGLCSACRRERQNQTSYAGR